MSKKIVSILLMLVILTVGCVAVCAEQPSPTLPGKIVAEVETEVEADEGFIIYVTDPTEKAAVVLDEISAAASFADYLGDDAAALLGDDASKLALDEFWSLFVENYKEEYGKAIARFETVEEYSAEDKLVGLVGFVNGDKVDWQAVEAEGEDGKLKVAFEKDMLVKINDGAETVFALLRAAE